MLKKSFFCHPGFQRGTAIFVIVAALFSWLQWYNVSLHQSTIVSVAVAAILGMIWLIEHHFYPSQETIKEKSPHFDWGMHYLRAFAIFCIVIMHIMNRFDMLKINRAFFAASTVYFLFISGYLCQYLALKKPIVDRIYYKKKFLNVILPYIIMSLITLGLLYLTDTPRVGVSKLNTLSWGAIPEILILGKAQNQYWYIPFVTILFLGSPLISRLPLKVLVWLTVVSFAVAIVIPPRVSTAMSFSFKGIFFKYSYFSFYYLVGFLYARLKKEIDPYLKAYAIPALLLGLLISVNTLYPKLFGKFMIRNAFAFSFQKFLFLIPVLLCAIALKNKKIAILDLLAEYSFSLFFTHYFFIQDWIRIRNIVHEYFASSPETLLLAVDIGLMLLFVLQNLLLAIILKRAVGRCSRSIIGA